MYQMVLYIEGEYFSAVSRSKRKLREWSFSIHRARPDASAHNCAWMMRDETGWCDGSPDAHEHIFFSPGSSIVLW